MNLLCDRKGNIPMNVSFFYYDPENILKVKVQPNPSNKNMFLPTTLGSCLLIRNYTGVGETFHCGFHQTNQRPYQCGY